MPINIDAADPLAQRSPLLLCKLRPVVDWISLDVRLSSPSQHRHVLDALAGGGLHVTFADPLDRPESSHRFRLRVQDPPGPDAVLTELHQALGIGEGDITVRGLEVALDAYMPVGSSPDGLVTVAAYMLWATATPPAGQIWINGKGLGNSTPARNLKPPQIRQRFAGPFSANIGTLEEEKSGMRVYVKREDTVKDGARRVLPQAQHRARLERRLMGRDVPFAKPTIAGWRAFNFERLAPLFAQVRIDPKASGNTRVMLEQWKVQLGRTDDLVARQGHRRLSQPGVVRDTPVNEAIRVALRRLTTAQRRGRRLTT